MAAQAAVARCRGPPQRIIADFGGHLAALITDSDKPAAMQADRPRGDACAASELDGEDGSHGRARAAPFEPAAEEPVGGVIPFLRQPLERRRGERRRLSARGCGLQLEQRASELVERAGDAKPVDGAKFALQRDHHLVVGRTARSGQNGKRCSEGRLVRHLY